MFANKIMIWEFSGEPKQNQRRGLVDRKLFQAPRPPSHPSNLIAGRPKAALLFWSFGSLVILDVVCRYLLLFVLYINIEIGKIDVKC